MQYDYDGKGEVVILCPTRENPAGALDMVRSVYETQHRIGTEVILVVDQDDPRLGEYQSIPSQIKYRSVRDYLRPDPPRVMIVEGGSLTLATNEAVERIWDTDSIIGHIGDDHHFMTPGWDAAIRDTLLASPGVAYTHDGFPTTWASMWFTNAIVPRTLGWLALPGTKHLAIDDAFMDLGAGLGRLSYLPDFLIKHKHEADGVDIRRDQVAAHYAKRVREQESKVYTDWQDGPMWDDIATVGAALGIDELPPRLDQPGRKFRKRAYLQMAAAGGKCGFPCECMYKGGPARPSSGRTFPTPTIIRDAERQELLGPPAWVG